VRHSGGGLPEVKAIGVRLPHRGIVQVSLNLTNYRVTPIEQAFAAVKSEAARHGVEVLESELIGLIPSAALDGTTPGSLMLSNFSEDRILEKRLARIGAEE
jgi:glutamate formiminotransferase